MKNSGESCPQLGRGMPEMAQTASATTTAAAASAATTAAAAAAATAAASTAATAAAATTSTASARQCKCSDSDRLKWIMENKGEI
jgi:hypothetical protein